MIIVVWVISLLLVYMMFLICLDPLLNNRLRGSNYMEHTNEEVCSLLADYNGDERLVSLIRVKCGGIRSARNCRVLPFYSCCLCYWNGHSINSFIAYSILTVIIITFRGL